MHKAPQISSFVHKCRLIEGESCRQLRRLIDNSMPNSFLNSFKQNEFFVQTSVQEHADAVLKLTISDLENKAKFPVVQSDAVFNGTYK